VIEEHERTHHAPLNRGQYAPHLEPAKVTAPLIEHKFRHGDSLRVAA
jgi:hypothetical protein